MGRPATCDCGECRKCKHRVRARLSYQAKSPEERRAIVECRDPEKVRARDRERYYRHHESRRAAMHERRHLYPTKTVSVHESPQRAARVAVGNAIRSGKLVRQPCEKCGAKAQAHHEDYTQPLEVRWLCPAHHGEEHRMYEVTV